MVLSWPSRRVVLGGRCGRCVKVVIVGELRGSVWSRAYYISFSCVFYLAPLSVNIFR